MINSVLYCYQLVDSLLLQFGGADTLKGIWPDQDFIDPTPSSIVQRYVRAEGETINYVTSLRAIARYCEYGDTLNMMLRDCLVCGINHQAIQRRLLAKKKLTFDKALEIYSSSSWQGQWNKYGSLQLSIINHMERVSSVPPQGRQFVLQELHNTDLSASKMKSFLISGGLR